MSIKKTKGQSTVEYIILITAVIVVILLFRTTFESRMNQTLGNSTTAMNVMSKRLNSAFAPSP